MSRSPGTSIGGHRRLWRAAVICALAAPLAGVSLAGHAAATPTAALFDSSRPATIKGVVAKLDWGNPHVMLRLYVPEPGGRYRIYVFESDSVMRLSRLGWTPALFAPGDMVAIDYLPLRDGSPGGKLIKVVCASGKTLATTTAAIPIVATH